MKLLINLCAHDGIISHYAGVGTIVKRYIEALQKVIIVRNIEYEFCLYTPQYNEFSFGYSKNTFDSHKRMDNVKVFQISNGTDGDLAYGTPNNWKTLSYNTAAKINEINFDNYDLVLTIANDTPYADMLRILKNVNNHIKVWIPHSTGKIHLVDSSIENSEKILNDRIEWETNAVNFINFDKKSFLGVTGGYIGRHLTEEYNLNENKKINIINGEILSNETEYFYDKKTKELFDEINKNDNIILSFGRAEKYKNLNANMDLALELGIKSIILVQGYYEGQPLVNELQTEGKIKKSIVLADTPFYLPQYIVSNFKKNMILLIPSQKEIVGLIINEIRKLNRENVLIVANDIGGMHEQIDSGIDGVLVDLNNIKQSAKIINRYFNSETMSKMNKMSQLKLREKYDFEKICDKFIEQILKIKN